ncbi:MAG TPA: hypothetical protein VF775_01130 [Geobacteraceae bacterium]
MKRVEVMKRAGFVKQGSRMVFVCNVSDLEPDDALQVIQYTEDIIKRMPKKSVLALAYLVNVKHNQEMEANIQYLLDKCAPHVSKGAYCGMNDRELQDEIERLLPSSGSNRKTFGSREEALSWLVASGTE